MAGRRTKQAAVLTDAAAVVLAAHPEGITVRQIAVILGVSRDIAKGRLSMLAMRGQAWCSRPANVWFSGPNPLASSSPGLSSPRAIPAPSAIGLLPGRGDVQDCERYARCLTSYVATTGGMVSAHCPLGCPGFAEHPRQVEIERAIQGRHHLAAASDRRRGVTA